MEKIETIDVENLNRNLNNLNNLSLTLTKSIEEGTVQKTLSSIAETSNKLGAFVDQTNEDLNLKELSTELTDTLNQLTAIAEKPRQSSRQTLSFATRLR